MTRAEWEALPVGALILRGDLSDEIIRQKLPDGRAGLVDCSSLVRNSALSFQYNDLLRHYDDGRPR